MCRTSITLVNRSQLTYNTDSPSSSSTSLYGGSALVPIMKSTLSVGQLIFSNAMLYLGIQYTLDLFCPSVFVQDSGLTVQTPLITWHFDSMSISGNIAETAAISH
ncbi:hypothetical protein PROFUN_08949 [Planoprotostelium fungivorum]|uniref:Uncharacterized protein n=1 Tax=Planoprotostelium fungivorum TaxID=1890364 RepID=A0A2P6NIR4_9EUKA|nr:hypothetical protein PROFUN_08949 [Planoprotostelium fungivorum]